jgi:phospholipid-binding lipoprotein MlaA
MVFSACAPAPAEPEALAEYKRNNDPAEPTNRVIFAGNKFVDDNAVQPVARAYQEHVPSRAQKSVHNVVANLGEPAVALNDVLQGNFGRSWNTIQRFAINTTVGGAGLFDVATDWDRPGHTADFGQTLGVWGIGPGASVQLPLLGPSTVRDSVGKVADLVANPVNFIPGGMAATVGLATGTAGAVDGRARALDATDSLERNSLDYYAASRSAAAQRRAALVAEGKEGKVGARPLPELSQSGNTQEQRPAAGVRDLCQADSAKFCADAAGPQKVRACMQSNATRLAPACRSMLETAGMISE